MKKLILPILALVLAGTVRADITITQDVEQAGEPKKSMTMKIKDQKMRMDMGSEVTMLMDLKSGDMATFMHAQKVIMKVSGDKLKGLQKEMQAKNADTKVEPPKATGKKETINGYSCDEYEMTVDGATVDVWMTKDLPAAEKAMSDMASTAGLGDPIQNALKSQQLSGFPMKTVVDRPGVGKITTTVASINQDALPASDFTAPTGYKEMQLPAGMPGQ